MAGNQGAGSSVMEKCIIVAVADNWAIGRGNDMPWHISEDLKFFKRTTSGHPVIMGRRTFESIGRPLPKRTNIVVTRGFDAPETVVQVQSLQAAFEAAEKALAEAEEKKCFVMGGGQLYRAAMELADKLYITHVHAVIEDADTYFPEIDPEVWEVAERQEMMHDEETGFDFEHVTYTRRQFQSE